MERINPKDLKDVGEVMTFQHHLARYNWALDKCFNKRVADIACGTGYGTKLIGNIANVVGMDKFRPIGIKSFKIDLNTDFIPGEYDVIVSFETIEHLRRPKYFLNRVKQALAKGGLFIFSIPNNAYNEFHLQHYNRWSAKEMIEKVFPDTEWFGQKGLTIGEITNNSNFFIGVCKNG